MDTSDDEATAAAAETKKKTPKAAAAKGKATGKGKAAAGPKASAKESSLLKQSELPPRSPFSLRISGFSVGLSYAFCIFSGVCAAESPAEFFAENKNIAGFDNVSCSLRAFSRFGCNS